MTTTTPPPSSYRRSVELDAVRDVMLLETDERRRTEPIARHPGPPARRGTIEGELNRAIVAEDVAAERLHSLALAKLHFERDLDLDRAVQLLHRALEIDDNSLERAELARQLRMMGRHIESGHVLRDGQPASPHEVAAAWLQSGDAYARAGETYEAIATYREVAMLAPDDPRPFANIATLTYWDADSVPGQRAADAMLEAAKRVRPHDEAEGVALACAFECAPGYARSAEMYTRLLRDQGRFAAADEVWREYGHASGHAHHVAEQRVQWSRRRGQLSLALAAALDHCIALGPAKRDRDGPLGELLADERIVNALRQHAADDQPFAAGLLAVARTRSSMGRAEAFVKVARRFHGELRALLLTFGSEAFAAAGNVGRARSTARRAVATAPWLARAHAATVTVASGEQLGAGDLEAAAGRLPRRAPTLVMLAERLQADGYHDLALAMIRRVMQLRPGDPEVVAALINRSLTTGKGDLIQQALLDALQAIVPWKQISSPLRAAVEAIAEQDLDLALELVRTVLEVIGPGDEPLYRLLRRVAHRAGNAAFETALTLRRAVGDDVEDEDRGSLYLEAVEMCLAHGDVESAAEHLYCAAAHGGPLAQLTHLLEVVGADIEALPVEHRPDAQLALAHAAAWTAEQRDSLAAGEAWRRLGAMRWDLARDEVGGDEAFFVACAHDPENGPYRYATDLENRAGPERAVAMLVDRAVAIGDEGDDPALSGRLYAAAARVAADQGLDELALNAAVAAVQADSARGDAVAIVEKLATGEEGLVALEFVYETLAKAALGRYGFRAAHYRAARQLEKCGALDSALKHAIIAFEAVPSIGASYKMLLRLAARAGDEGTAVRALAGVAASFPTETEIAWLLRAADLARQFSGAEELRFDLLLKAFKLRQTPELAAQLAASARELAAGATDQEVVHIRLERAITEALPALNSTRGANTAIVLAAAAIEALSLPPLAVKAISRALEIDRERADFGPLLPHIDAIATQREVARPLLEQINELRSAGAVSLSQSLKDVTSRLYLLLSDLPPPPASIPAVDSEAPVSSDGVVPPAGQRRPSEPVIEAVHEVVELDDAMLEAALIESIGGKHGEPARGAERQGQAWRDEAAVAESAKRPSEATEARYPYSLGSDLRGQNARDARVANAVEVLAGEDALEQIEYVEQDGRLVPSVAPPAPEQSTTRSARAGRDQLGGGLDEAIAAAEEDARRAQAAEDLRHSSRPPGDDDGYAFEPAPTAAPITGRPPARTGEQEGVLAAIDFSPGSEQRARQRGDHAAIAAMLGARAGSTSNLAQRRLVRLRRAAVLEQRLGRLEDACEELETILEESGEDATALRYLADLYGRIDRPTRAARMWLRASKQASRLDEKLRDVIRCCEALVLARRPETAKRLLDAASGLPQSPRLLRLRAAVARHLGDAELAATVEAELASLGPPDEGGSVPPSESLHALTSSPPTQPPPPLSAPEGNDSDGQEVPIPPPPATPRQPSESSGPAERKDRPVSSRRVFRLGVSALAEGDPRKVLDRCLHSYLEHGVGGERQARETVRALRTVAEYLDEENRDLHTFLLVQALEAVQGRSAAMAELQRHWETLGGTPLVALAVADHLERRGDLRPALRLYERSFDRQLHGIRSPGQLALDAADLARRAHDQDAVERYLERALGHAEARAGAQQRYAEWFGRDARPHDPPGAPPAAIIADRHAEAPSGAESEGEEPPHRESLDDIELDDSGSVASHAHPTDTASQIPSSPPSAMSLVRRPPTFPEFVGPHEQDLFDEMITGSYEAGNSLVALYTQGAEPRRHDVLAVRRYQATLRRGDQQALAHLRAAAFADGATALARCVEHVLGAFDPAFELRSPPPLEQLARHPQATTKLLFAPLAGTVNEALAIAWQSGLMHQEPTTYQLSGPDRVAPVATTAVGRVYASLNRLLDLHGARLFHRDRESNTFSSSPALLSPPAAILCGRPGADSATMRYRVGSALAATRPELVLALGLDEPDAHNLMRALVAGFGPVEDGSVTEASIEQMRIAEDLWHLVSSDSERRLRTICRNRREMSYEVALANAQSMLRRTGLFAAGDFRVAVAHALAALNESLPRKRREGQLRELCNLPEIADLYDLAILPEFALARWTGK